MEKELFKKVNRYIANLGVEYIKLHNLHWNVIGVNFKPIHEYLEVLYDGITASFDVAAELLKMHGETPAASLKEYLEISDIDELSSEELNGKEVLEIVLDDFSKMKALAEEIRTEADELDLYDVVDFLENDLNNYNKSIWFIKSMLK